MKHQIIKRCGRYALLIREIQYDEPKYIVACGYDDKTGEWNQGYYYHILENGDPSKETAMKEFNNLSGFACAKCKHVNDGCTYCKR